MTDGIIQKTISKFLLKHHPIRGYDIITSDEIINELQQELITEIKKAEFTNADTWILIGDNEK